VPRNAKKQCADKHLGTKFRQRGISLYLAVIFLPLILPFTSIDSADRTNTLYYDNAPTRAVDSLARADETFDHRDAKLV